MRSSLLAPLGFILPFGLSTFLAVSFYRTAPEAPAVSGPAPLIVAPESGSGPGLPPLTGIEAARTAIAVRPLLAEHRRLQPLIEVEPVEDPPPQPEPEPEPVADTEPEPAPIPEESPPSLPEVKAIGYISNNGSPRVLIRMLESGSEVWMGIGERLEDWTLVEITQEAATFETDGTQVAIKMFE